uniref:DNA/RNA non-specific endonuclease n=1 Tax=Alistipes sp. TaxID=1872444 RepID=UPI004055B352
MKRVIWMMWASLALLMWGCADHTSDFDIDDYIEPNPEQPTAPPTIVLEGEDTMQVDEKSAGYTLNYTIQNPLDGASLRARSDAEWISTPEIGAETIRFRVEANADEAPRTGSFLLSYKSAEKVIVTVIQAGKGGEMITHPTLSGADVTVKSATSATFTVKVVYTGTVRIEHLQLLWQKSTEDQIWQAEELPAEVKTHSYTLTNLQPESDYRYRFVLEMADGYTTETAVGNFSTPSEEIVIVEPAFTALAATGITPTEATLSCHFAYTGSEPISESGFCYRTTGGVEQEAMTGTALGTKQVKLTGLSPETTYTWYFYAVVGGELYTSDTKSFTTGKESVTPAEGRVWRTTWPELPVEETSNSDYYFAHHITDLTMGGQKARNYTVCYSAEHHCPVWVAAPRHSSYEGSTKRTDAYKQDPQIPSNIQYSSKDTGGGCNKGHMLGSAERTASTETNRQVFYYTNIAPQYSTGFNTGGGGWNTLEDWIDGHVCSDTTYLVIGTYFERYTDGYGVTATPKKISFGGRSDVSCPTMFYIAVLRTKSGRTGKSVINCSSSELKCAAFVRTHSNTHKGQKVTSREMMSIADLERLTGHQFFVNVPNAPKQNFSASDWGL